MHFRVRGYLRQNGKTDMSKYHLDWANEESTIGRWDYDDLPEPSADQLAAVPQQFIDDESETSDTCTCGIYTGQVVVPAGARVGTSWWFVALTAARHPFVSSPAPESSTHISIDRGFWKFTLVGNCDTAITIHIGHSNNIITVRTMGAGQFDITVASRLLMLTTIWIKVHRQNDGVAVQLNSTLLIEKR